MLFIGIDIGNTNVSIGVFPIQSLKPARVFKISSWEYKSTSNYKNRFISELKKAHVDPRRVAGAAIASVVPTLNNPLKRICRDLFHRKALLITHRIKTGVKIITDKPGEVGTDRIVNACAAHRLFGKKTIVVDFGTATTFDCVSKRGEYLGGAICPGPKLAAQALATHTAKLPLVWIEKPKRVIGKNTADCIRSGLFFGYVGLVREILKRIRNEMGAGTLVIAAGGDAKLIARRLPEINRIIPDLTLKGIKIIWELNQRRKKP